MSLVEKHRELLARFLPSEVVEHGHTYYACSRCLYVIKYDIGETCGDCEDVCDYHMSDLCEECYADDLACSTKPLYGILNAIFQRHGGAVLSDVNDVINQGAAPDILEYLLCTNISSSSNVQQLIALGANVDADYTHNAPDAQYKWRNPNYTLLTHALSECSEDCYRSVIAAIAAASNGSVFTARDVYNRTALGFAIFRYIHSQERSSNDIRILMQNGADIADEPLNFVGISGSEYGDRAYSGYKNHYWRRRRIDWLISIGAIYYMNRCIKYSCDNCECCRTTVVCECCRTTVVCECCQTTVVCECSYKLLRQTRLGYYLQFRAVLAALLESIDLIY